MVNDPNIKSRSVDMYVYMYATIYVYDLSSPLSPVRINLSRQTGSSSTGSSGPSSLFPVTSPVYSNKTLA